MKKIFLLLLLAMPAAVFSQTLRVNVSNGAYMLPGAFVYVNDVPVAFTDHKGTAEIPYGRLHDGDMIKAGCLGTYAAWAPFDLRMREQGECNLVLYENFVATDGPGVDDKKVYKFFKANTLEYTADIGAAPDFAMLSEFSMYGWDVDGNVKMELEGQVVASEFKWSTPTHMSREISFRADADTTGVSLDAYSILTAALFVSPIYPLQKAQNGYVPWIRYGYLGQRQDCHVFRLAFSDQDYPEIGCQVMAFIDQKSGIPVFVEYEIIDIDTNIKFDYRFADFFVYNSSQGRVALYAGEVEFRGKLLDGVSEVRLYDIVYSPK